MDEVAESKPTVFRLQIHLKDQQTFYFDTNDKDQSLKRFERIQRKNLTSFYELSKHNDFAKTLFYMQVPEPYTWQSGPKCWKRKNRKLAPKRIPDTIGRLYSIHPSQIELFSL